jgi:ATP-binding cassette subfamily B protein
VHAPPADGRHAFRRALQLLAPYRVRVPAILLLALVAGAVNAAEPLALKQVFDALVRRSPRGVAIGVALLIGIVVVRKLGQAVLGMWIWRTRFQLHYALTEAGIERLRHRPADPDPGEDMGALLARLDRGIQDFVNALTELALHVFPAVAYLAASASILLLLDVRLAAAVLAFAPIPAVVGALAAPRQVRRERALVDRWARIHSRFGEVLSGIVRGRALEDAARTRLLAEVGETNRLAARGAAFDHSVTAAQGMAAAGARIVTLAIGGALVLRGNVSVGTLIAALGYLGGLFAPVGGLSGMFRTLHGARASLGQVLEILDAEGAASDAQRRVATSRTSG